MTVLAILPGGRRPEGRPSNAALQMEARTLRHAIATLTEAERRLIGRWMLIVPIRQQRIWN